MTTDADILRAANLLIQEFGDMAAMGAMVKADHLLSLGEPEAHDVWLRVAEAAEDLLSEARPDAAQVH